MQDTTNSKAASNRLIIRPLLQFETIERPFPGDPSPEMNEP
jgi:hypothetical protein